MRNQTMARIVAFMMTLVLVLSLCTTALGAKAKYATIPKGEKGNQVRVMQNALKKQGYYKGSVDGTFGPDTLKAVKKFQAAMGLKADGKPGNKTLIALYDGGSKAINNIDGNKAALFKVKDEHSIYYGSTGSRVRGLQKALKAAGYFKGSLDGKFGEMTELAVRKFQTAKGLHVDGVAGRKTIASLNKAQKSIKLSSGFVLDEGSKGSSVKAAQQKFVSMGYNLGTDTYGTYGEWTASIVKHWQGANGYSATGALTEKEYNKLILP